MLSILDWALRIRGDPEVHTFGSAPCFLPDTGPLLPQKADLLVVRHLVHRLETSHGPSVKTTLLLGTYTTSTVPNPVLQPPGPHIQKSLNEHKYPNSTCHDRSQASGSSSGHSLLNLAEGGAVFSIFRSCVQLGPGFAHEARKKVRSSCPLSPTSTTLWSTQSPCHVCHTVL